MTKNIKIIPGTRMDWMTLLIGAIIFLCIYWFATWNHTYWKNRGFPYIKETSIIKNSFLINIFLNRKSINEVYAELYEQFKDERLVGILRMKSPYLLVFDPELIYRILIKDFTHFYDRGLFFDDDVEPLTASIFNLNGMKWKNTRSKLLPTFTSSKMKLMFDEIKDCADSAMHYFKKNISKDFEARDKSTKFSLNVIACITFGIEIDALNDNKKENIKFIAMCKRFFEPKLFVLLRLILVMSLPHLKKLLRFKLIDEEVSKYFTNLVNDIIKYRESSGIRRKDFLQLMLDLKNQEIHDSKLSLSEKNEKFQKFVQSADDSDDENLGDIKNETADFSNERVITDSCIVAHTFTFLSAGADTTASTISFSLYELAVNPDVQDRLQNEVDSVISNGNFNYESLKKLNYMDKFLNEVTRLYGTSELFRICTKDYKIPDSNLVIEKGTKISIPLHPLHRDPKYFPEPNKFNPDRFEDMDSIPKGAFIPFGDGPRMCIAKRLVVMELKIFLVRCLSQFNICLSEKTKLPLEMDKRSVVNHVVGGIWIRFEERKNNKT